MVRCGKGLTTLASALLAVVILGGCKSTVKIPIYAETDLMDRKFEQVALMPMVDRRVDKSHQLNLESSIGDKVENNLKGKGYQVTRPGAFSPTSNPENQAVAEMEPRELANLGSQETEYMLFVYLDDASSKTALGYSFKMEATAMLIHKPTGKMLWKDKGISSQGQGGLAGCLMSGMVKGEALSEAVNTMLKSFPLAPAKRKA